MNSITFVQVCLDQIKDNSIAKVLYYILDFTSAIFLKSNIELFNDIFPFEERVVRMVSCWNILISTMEVSTDFTKSFS